MEKQITQLQLCAFESEMGGKGVILHQRYEQINRCHLLFLSYDDSTHMHQYIHIHAVVS